MYCIHLIYFRKVVSGVQLTNGNVEKADIYILAMGIMANPMGRSIGINLPVYPLKGNIVTVPLKVKHMKKSQKIESSILSQLGTFRNECVQPRARFVDLSTQTQFGTNFRRRTGCRIQLEVISLSFCQNPWDYTTFFLRLTGSIRMVVKVFWKIHKKYSETDTLTQAKRNTLRV